MSPEEVNILSGSSRSTASSSSGAPVPPSPQPSTRFAALRRKRFVLPLLIISTVVVFFALNNRSNGGQDTAAEVAGVEVEVEGTQQTEVTTTTSVPESATTTSTSTSTPTSTTTTTTLLESEAAIPLESSFAPVGEVELAATFEVLNEVNVVERLDNRDDFERDDYANGWPDSDGDCQSDRHEVLIEESAIETVLDGDGCQVELGLWIDPYDGTGHNIPRDVAIDRLVPLAHAHRAGAWQWDEESKQAFASDVSSAASLLAVGAGSDEAKGDRGPDRWRPPLEDAWCRYAIDWTAVKVRWDLSFTRSEVTALDEMLATCEPVAAGSDAPAPAVELASPTTTVPERQGARPGGQAGGAADVRISWCRARDEMVQLRNAGDESVTLNGWVLHDEGRDHEVNLRRVTLEPDERVVLLSGRNTEDTTDSFRWSDENVWNNGGDTATLLNRAGDVVATERCDLQRE